MRKSSSEGAKPKSSFNRFFLFSEPVSIPNQFVTRKNKVSIFLKREDLLHPEISGNKFRKLKYNLDQALAQNQERILTFGGAFSNHIAATAAAGRMMNLETIGIVRGEELGKDLQKTLAENPTLSFAAVCGMKFKFVSRDTYRAKEDPEFLKQLKEEFGSFFLIPEGGTNDLAVKGCEEILTEDDRDFDFICTSVGTGGTLSGLINSASENQKVLGFPALKGNFLVPEIERFSRKNNWELITNYHFGGYAKVTRELINFINDFRRQYDIQLDPVYTGKMMYGIFDLIEKGYFPENTCILAIHTGGLQGIQGMNKRLNKKELPQIDV